MKTPTGMQGRAVMLGAGIAAATTSGAAIALAATPADPAAPAGAPPVRASAQRHERARGRLVKLTVHADRSLLVGTDDHVRGSLAPRERHAHVVIEVRRGGGWYRVADARTGRRGRFSASWRPGDVGKYALRARLADRTAHARIHGNVLAYRESNVSYYGPGFYGHSTACGGSLSPGTLGVANKTLPCGTRVALRYGDRAVTVRVIDRGPYVAGREYDLTAATKDRLGMPSTGTLWSAPLQ